MDFGKLAKKAEEMVQERGGMKSVEEDGKELLDIAKGDGSATDKLKAAAQAIKVPGAPNDQQ